ncbi:hypothetical protein HUG17_3667 [Dermatophagoides farinae]|uniref:Uncharacterized protein n=1 Tax=Dermatophagoides farinae TaxID=6954 RepID=A0A9D4NWI5_DERFA|nr:hypothetical protein HUG17_3667 [Dermatophagoides farinae]
MHAVKKVPTMHYNGHTKDKKSLMRVSINRCYVTVQKKRMRTSSRSSIIDQVSFIDWQMVHKIQFGKNRIKIVPNSKKFIKQKTIKAYFDKKVLNFLRKSCNKLNYIKPVKRRWFSLSNTKDYQPINRENSRTNSSSSSSNETYYSSLFKSLNSLIETDDDDDDMINNNNNNKNKKRKQSLS